jgi:hypothetical protein
MTTQIKVTDHKEKDELNKLIATPKAGKQPMIIIDQLGLALLLMNVYGQGLHGTDWTHERGEMFIFEDNPIVRTCVEVWRESIKDNDIMSTTERFLFNLLDFGDRDLFIEIERIEMEKRARFEEIRQKYGLAETETSNLVTNKGDNSNE